MRQSFLLNPTLIYTVLVFCSASCLKKDPEPAKELPPITTTGEQTFGCLVNGEVWLPESDRSSWIAVYSKKGKQSFSMNMSQYDYDKGGLQQAISFYINPFNNAKNYPLFSFPQSNGLLQLFKEEKEFWSRSGLPGQLNILLWDSTKHIISGTFEFIAVDTITFDTIKVSEGRFDLNYNF